MTDLLNFIPVRRETAAMIRARLQSDLNAGKDPNSQSYYDTGDGTVTGDLLQTIALELERAWDTAATDVVAAGFPSTAWGDYLDEHGIGLGIPRHGAIRATGALTFTGDDGIIIASGTEVATEQEDADDEPVVIRTTESGTIASGTLTLEAEAAEAGTDGNILTGAATQILSPIDAEVQPDVGNADAFSGGTDVETDEAYSTRLVLENSAAQGGGSIADYKRWALGYEGVGGVRVVPLWLGPGTVRLVITDTENNPSSATVVEALQNYLDPPSATGTLSVLETLPGDGVLTIDEDTAPFSDTGRLIVGENLIEYTAKTTNTFTGCTGGSGTVPGGTKVTQSGQGQAQAPVGHIVTVDTPVALPVTVAATIELDDGYSLDGSGGTIGVEEDIEQSLRDYIDELPPGGDDPPGSEVPPGSGVVIYNKILSRFFQVEGVYDISSVTLNAATVDLDVDPLEVPGLTTLTLS